MILAQAEIRAEVEKGSIIFDPPLLPKQWGEATVNLRLGTKFTKLKPWQPGWGGRITLEIRNSRLLQIDLTPLDDMPRQMTFFRLTREVPETAAYGSRATNLFQNQTSALPKKE